MTTYTSTIAIPFELNLLDGDYIATIHFPDSPVVYISEHARTEAKARAKLKAAAQAALYKAAAAERNYSMRVIGCNDGTVFIVRWHPEGEFEYRIAGAGRDSMTVTFGAMPDFQTALQKARDHATENFGGIAWENY
jgi:hypothetical protein